MTPAEFLLVIIIVAAGSALQATLGFGLALVTGPLLVLLDRAYVPGPILVAGLVLTLSMAIRGRKLIDWSGLRPAIAGRVIGTIPAAWIIGVISVAAFDILFGVMVLAAVGVSLLHRNIQPTPRVVFGASIASGFMSTTSAIGGPALALVYQSRAGDELRATLAGLFVVGCLISLTALTLAGKFGPGDFLRSAVVSGGVVIGLLLAPPLVRFVDRRASLRPWILGLSTISATAVLIRGLLHL
jgi:uncharacterized membrane protein YfcA